MNPLRTLIVDDEPPARDAIAAVLEGDPDVAVVGQCEDGEAALAAIRRLRPELVFLDVQMPHRDGFEVVEALKPAERPAFVFVTAFDQHAIRAFELSAVDYLLKPFSDRRLADALARAKERVRAGAVELTQARLRKLLEEIKAHPPKSPALDRIAFKADGDTCFARAQDIIWVEAQRDFLRVCVDRKFFQVRDTLHRFAAVLAPPRFQRVHRSFIVNVDHVRRISTRASGQPTLTMSDGAKVPVGRSYRETLALFLG